MANIKQYTLTNASKDWTVVVEVNHDVLTAELATEINEFWSGEHHRIIRARGDVVRAVITLAAENAVYCFLEEGGAFFEEQEESTSLWWTRKIHEREGWGGMLEGTVFGSSGIRLISADVDAEPALEFTE